MKRSICAWRAIGKAAVAIALCHALGSCEQHADVSDRRALWGGYVRDEIYTLNFDVFLMRKPALLWIGGDPILAAPGEVHFPTGRIMSAPYSIPYYQTGEHVLDELGRLPDSSETSDLGFVGSWGHGDVLGIIREGTRLRAKRVRLTESWSPMFGKTKGVTVFAEILDGDFAGKEADLRDLSDFADERVDGLIVYEPFCVVFCQFAVVN